MNMLQAIALSAGNKAKAINDEGKRVVVQQIFVPRNGYYWFLWLLKDKNNVASFSTESFQTIQVTCHVDPEADYWQSV